VFDRLIHCQWFQPLDFFCIKSFHTFSQGFNRWIFLYLTVLYIFPQLKLWAMIVFD
jgi:hypothetical protein